MTAHLQTATFGAGCFWGIEAAFRSLVGVVGTTAGYVGNTAPEVGDAPVARAEAQVHPEAQDTVEVEAVEAVQVVYDPDEITYGELLELFWSVHDPTLAPRPDRPDSRRYRSVIVAHSPDQHAAAEASRAREQERYLAPIVTEVASTGAFWAAPAADQQYFEQRGINPLVVLPPDTRAQLNADIRSSMEMASTPLPTWDGVDFAEEFGGCFNTWLAADLGRVFLDSAETLSTLVSSLRAWLAASAASSSPNHPGIRRAVVTSRPVATQAELRCATDGSELTFVANLRPGNFMTRQGSPHISTSTTAWARESAPGIDHQRGHGTVPAGHAGVVAAPGADTPPAERDPAIAGRWYEHIPPAELTLDKGSGLYHRIRWHRGKLALENHFKLADERKLVALGADVCECLLVREVWNPAWSAQRWHTEPLGQVFERCLDEWTEVAEGRSPFASDYWQPINVQLPLRRTWLARRHLPDPTTQRLVSHEERLLVNQAVMELIRQLPAAFRVRWVLGAMVSLERRIDGLDLNDRVALQAGFFRLLRPAVLETLWQWCRSDPAIEHGTFECGLVRPGEAPIIEGSIDGGHAQVVVAQPFDWATRVWARGLATIDGRFVVDIAEPDPHGVDRATEPGVLPCTLARWLGRGSGSIRLVTEPGTIRWIDDRWQLDPAEASTRDHAGSG